MDIEQAKAEVARRAHTAGYAFDPGEIITGPLEGKILVALRSVRALRTIEQDDGSVALEMFNDPIIWIETFAPGLIQQSIVGLSVRISIPIPQVRMLHPEFAILVD